MTAAALDLLTRLEADRDGLIAFFQDFLRAPSPNPPGDTRCAVAVLARFLDARGVPFRIESAVPHLPNVVGSYAMADPGRHLVLNGHVDVFAPIDDASAWTGALRDGRLFGRGAVDMKCGTAASAIAYAYLHQVRDRLRGRLTLTCVADEETGGRWGTAWLMDRFPAEVTGDCCLNGEPSGLNNVRFMEKGTLRLTVSTRTPGGHGGYPHLAPNAIVQALGIVRELMALDGREPELPADVARLLLSPEAIAATERGMGAGAARVVRSVVVNVGTIQGGLKVNQIPNACRLEVEIRYPIGTSRAAMLDHVEAAVAAVPGAAYTIDEAHSYPPSLADPAHEMLTILQDTVEGLGLPRPVPLSSLGGSDARYWRWQGVPAFLYGPSPVTMGRADEHVTVDEFWHVVRTHVLAAATYLAR